MTKSALTPNLKTEHVDIDGIRFETTQFPAMRAYGLLTKLVKHIGPALSMLAEADGEANLAAMAPAVGMALGNLSETDAQRLLLEILASTTAETGGVLMGLGTQNAVDALFSGRLAMMFQVAAHALKVNYSDFFGGSAQDPATDPATPALQAGK